VHDETIYQKGDEKCLQRSLSTKVVNQTFPWGGEPGGEREKKITKNVLNSDPKRGKKARYEDLGSQTRRLGSSLRVGKKGLKKGRENKREKRGWPQ